MASYTKSKGKATASGDATYVYEQPRKKTNVLAIVSLVASLVGFVTAGLGSVAAIVCGHIALRQIKKSKETGSGIALAGLIIGYFVVALVAVLFIIIASAASLSHSLPHATPSH